MAEFKEGDEVFCIAGPEKLMARLSLGWPLAFKPWRGKVTTAFPGIFYSICRDGDDEVIRADPDEVFSNREDALANFLLVFMLRETNISGELARCRQKILWVSEELKKEKGKFKK